MDETLYHPEIFMPNWFEAPTERATLEYSRHALYALSNDRYGGIPQFETIPLCRFSVVELGVKHAKRNQLGVPAAPPQVSKIVVRGRYSSELDIVFVLCPRGNGKYFVKTCWFNRNDDKHKTLRRERYATA